MAETRSVGEEATYTELDHEKHEALEAEDDTFADNLGDGGKTKGADPIRPDPAP